MTRVPAYDEALRLLSLSADPVADILRTSAYWIPLQFIYCEMLKNKDIVRLTELPKEEKMKYWTIVKDVEGNQWKKVVICQALYVFDLVNKMK